MELFTTLSSWQTIAATAAVYFCSLIFYPLFLHPLTKFPGPKLAAITRYYEAYFDLIQNGQYNFKITEMHKKYGPIVRISPYELHVIDPAFHHTLYRHDGHWDKYAWNYDAFTAKGATICTPEHDLDKARRAPLNSFFSKAKVSNQQDMINRNIEKLCDRLSKLSKTTVNLGAAISAFAQDVPTEYILGRNYHSLDHEDFNIALTGVFQNNGHIWHTTKHVRWFGPLMKSIPVDWVAKVADENTKTFFSYLKIMEQDARDLMTAASTSATDEMGPRTIVNGILESDLPPTEKTFPRIYDDVLTVGGAGFETTASVLRLIIFHVFSNPEIIQRLRNELAQVSSGSSEAIKLAQLEQLPYLTSVLMEGLRLSPAVASRLQRISDKELVYGEWRIPPGTPVGMTNLFMHTDEALYPDPMRFNPDRWMDLDARKALEKTYAPFSKGTRICLGMHFAWAQMYMAMPALIQRFNFQFQGTSSKDFECVSDQFIIGTKENGKLFAFVTPYQTYDT